jgi:hypothetical protein
VASLLTSCIKAVPTTCQEDINGNGFVASLLTSCDNAVLNRLVASLLTSFGNAVPRRPTTFQQDVSAIGL